MGVKFGSWRQKMRSCPVKGTSYMDIIVKSTTHGNWNLVDLLGRHIGTVEEVSPVEYRITPGERVSETMRAMKHGPFLTLDDALSEIEAFTRSTCRLATTATNEA
jgi:hypothetical protein